MEEEPVDQNNERPCTSPSPEPIEKISNSNLNKDELAKNSVKGDSEQKDNNGLKYHRN